MLLKYEHKRIYAKPENNDEEELLKALHRRMADSNRLMSWWGDAEFDGKMTSSYIFTWLPDKEPGVGVPKDVTGKE